MGKWPKSLKWPKITFRSPIWVPRWSNWGVLGVVWVYKSGLRILIRAPKMPFLAPPKLAKIARLGEMRFKRPFSWNKFDQARRRH